MTVVPPIVLKKKAKKKFPYPLAFFAICGFCIWLIYRSLIPQFPKAGEPPILYSNQCQQDLRLTFVEAIREAKESIHLVMFGLSDSGVLKMLSQRIRHGLPTTVYYDPNGSPQLRRALEGAELHPVFHAGLMHQKILILDRDLVFIGSANMTTPSLRMHDNLVIGLRNRKVAQFLLQRIPNESGYMRTMVGGQDVEIWLLPDPRGHALADLRRQIRNAARSIKIALFTFTHPGLVDEVIAAKKRGVDVTIVVDLHSGLGASAKAVEALKQADVRVLFSQGIQLLHHKFIWIDDQTLLSGSANWTKAAFYKNSDCIVVLHQLTLEQRRFMKQLWHRIENEGRVLERKSLRSRD